MVVDLGFSRSTRGPPRSTRSTTRNAEQAQVLHLQEHSSMNITLRTLSCPFTLWRPRDGRVFDLFAYDTETTDIDDQRPYLTHSFVVGTACDGEHGVFLTRDTIPPF